MTDEDDFNVYQQQKQDVTKNLPKDWEAQLNDDTIKEDLERERRKQLEDTERKYNIQQKLDAAKKEGVDKIKAQKESADKKQRDLEARAAKQQAIAAKAELVRQNQIDKEKAQEFREMKARNEARLKLTANEQTAMLNAKSNSERIRVRQQIEARQRAESSRIEMANAGKTPPVGHRLITPGTVKESIRATVVKAPVTADKALTSMFGGFTDKLIAPTTSKQANVSYKREMKLMSKVVNRRGVTGGKVKQIMIVQKGDVFANPNFTSALLGNEPLQTQTGKSKKAVRRTPTSGLDRLTKMLLG